MTGLFVLLYWCVVTLLLGCVVAVFLPVRRLWLISAMAVFMAPFVLPPLIRDDDKAVALANIAFVLLVYLGSWTAGGFAGSALRRKGLNVIRVARLGGRPR